MSINLDELRRIIDQPDLDDALLHDGDGRFQHSVESYLNEWKAMISADLDKGLQPDEYEAMKFLGQSVEMATKLMEFFVSGKGGAEGTTNAPL